MTTICRILIYIPASARPLQHNVTQGVHFYLLGLYNMTFHYNYFIIRKEHGGIDVYKERGEPFLLEKHL